MKYTERSGSDNFKIFVGSFFMPEIIDASFRFLKIQFLNFSVLFFLILENPQREIIPNAIKYK